MKLNIAYLISAYSDAVQLQRLITALDEGTVDFYLHIDRRVNIQPFIAALGNKSNIFFIKKRFRVFWGSFAQVRYQQELLSSSLNSGRHYDRFVCLSGMDYPLWTNEAIKRYFAAHPQREYIAARNISTSAFERQKNRCRHYYFRDTYVKCLRPVFKIATFLLKAFTIQKQLEVPIEGKMCAVYSGSDYWALTNDCAKYVLEKMKTEHALMRYFKYSYVASEMVIQTIVFNSSFAKHALLFNDEGTYQGLKAVTPLHYIEYNSAIKVFTVNDFDLLMKSNTPFFRKARTGISDTLIQQIEMAKGQGA